jgi:hypothetical protein
VSVEDKDLGLKKIYANARRFDRTITVGIHDPELFDHAIAHEMVTGFIRDTFDGRQSTVDKELQDLHAATMAGTDPEPAQRAIADGYRDAYREALAGDELEDRDDVLQDGIGVEVIE